ncbi:MAG: DNA replication/repair protein RecF [Pseudomonadota bacterium]|nr:DNA replication/repair protein RecF [Pseudomonadota bacterium]
MSLASLRIRDLRCLAEAELSFGPHLNLIHGPNGSGKTSILEAAFLVGRGRSFRSRHTETLIRRGSDALQVFAQTADPAHRIGFEYRREESYVARVDGSDVSGLAELPRALFVEAIDPEVHRLVEGAPGERRRWLDWGVFHVEPQFLDSWQRFSRALRQRNAALKAGQDPRSWEGELIVQGEAVARARGHWFEQLKPKLADAIQRLAKLDVELAYYRGWAADRPLSEALEQSRDRDKERGSTQAGPQRADVLLRVAGKAARESLSRGQQKLVAAAMVLALLRRLREEGASAVTLLLDDPAAELDADRLSDLVAMVRELDCQLIITTLDPGQAPFGSPERMFHVEHGVARQTR